ncbi:MAG: tetratricopeptide repeat protein, partial [Oscillospiraceae bacterium]|nr:tetratricopeptide repeat protein [Oscillospiraceae bacterium]
GICTEHLLKEYNPKTLDIARDESGAIFVDNSDDVDAFEKGLVSFEKGYNIQLEIRRNLETKNTTANIQGIHEGNGTKYIDMTVLNGQTYDKIQENTLFDLLERTKAITKVIREYHKKGFLHLDLKPNNILALPETKELVMFFDFDSLLTKGEILSGSSVSYTKSWAAPELLLPGRRSKLCEATDIFSIGEIMFYQIFGRHSSPEERRSFANYEFEPNAEIFKDADQSIFKLLSELFSKTICGVISKRYTSADELIEMLDKLLPLANPKRTRIISTLPSVQSFFVGRDSEIEEIHGKLQENDLLFVSGMGGIGKSELVKNYANRYKDSYDAIIFAPYVTDFIMLITDDKSVSIANVEMLQGEQLAEYYDRKLRKLKELCNERTLLIIDNYDTQEDPNFEAVQSLNCKKIITTRLDFADFNVSQIEIGTISARSDVNRIFNEYYGKSLGEEDKITVDKIIDLVDCHTMTVELLAKQMKSGRVTPQKMLEVLTKGGLGESGKEKINAAKDSKFVRQSAYDHIRALFDISDLEENELYVLGNLSLIPHSGILTEQFKVWCELESYEEINSLENEGWIRRNEEDDIISLHPVVSDIAFELVKNESVNVEKLLCGITEYMSSDEYDTVDFEKRKDMNVLSMFCAERINKCSIETSAVADLLDRIANEVNGFGNLDLCREFAEKAMKIRVNLFGENSIEVAESYDSLGYFCENGGDLKKSEEFMLKALDIRRCLYGEMDGNTAASYNNLAGLYQEQGQLEKAEEFNLKALKIIKCLYGEMDGNTATLYNNLGSLYNEQGQFEKAEEFYLKALEIRRSL